MQQTVAGFAMWSAWQPERNLHFNSFFIERPDGNLAIDPLPLTEADAAEIERRGGLGWIVITNRDHERGARVLAERFGAKIAASDGDAPLLSGPVDRQLHDGEAFAGATVIALDGLKSPGEIALHFREQRAIVVGDALWGDPAGSLRLMPDQKLADPARAALSLRRLGARHPLQLLVGDGACIFGGAYEALWACLEARTDVYVNRVNIDELEWLSDTGHGVYEAAASRPARRTARCTGMPPRRSSFWCSPEPRRCTRYAAFGRCARATSSHSRRARAARTRSSTTGRSHARS